MEEVIVESKAKLTGMAIFWFIIGLIGGTLIGGFYLGGMSPFIWGFIFAFIFVIVFNIINGGNHIIVTKEHITGITSFKKKVSIPVDSVSAVASAPFSTVSITSSSGIIKFNYMEKRDDVYQAINSLLSERQKNMPDSGNTTIVTQKIPKSEAEELKKFKELLDSGIITEEEFNAKKKQLLGL